MIAVQVFLFYVRVKARLDNNRTEITVENPFSGILNSQLKQGDMVKNLASSILSKQMTVKEYDLKQVQNMNGSLLFNLAFTWFLHFRMKQMYPLMLQTIQGFATVAYSPLFQAYCLGKNLKRPFKTPQPPQMGPFGAPQEAATSEQTADDSKDNTEAATPTKAAADSANEEIANDSVEDDDDDDGDDEEEDDDEDEEEDDEDDGDEDEDEDDEE